MKIVMCLVASLSLMAVANAQSFSKCSITSAEGDIVGIINYAKGTFAVDSIDEDAMPEFVAAFNKVGFISVSKSTGEFKTNSGFRSMESGEEASEVVKRVVENELTGLYQIKCKELAATSDYWN